MTDNFFVYILLCADGTYYTGYSGDLSRRIKQHQSGAIPRAYTKPRRPVKMVWAGGFERKEQAREYERTIKRWQTSRKENLITEGAAQTEQIKQDQGITD